MRELYVALKAVLLDVGGTLWPDVIPRPGDPHALFLRQLARETGLALTEGQASAMRASLTARDVVPDHERLVHDLFGDIRRAAEAQGLVFGIEDCRAFQRAVCLPVAADCCLPGAEGLLRGIRDLGLRCVILSNTSTRLAADYWRNFADLGLAQFIDEVVISADVGFRKPHAAMFEAGLRAARALPSEVLVVGNSEINDILPAAERGMKTIRVAIEEPPPDKTRADAVATSLAAALTALRGMLAAEAA